LTPARPGPAVAYDAHALGLSVRRYVSSAERNLAILDDLGHQIEPLVAKLKPLLESSPAAAAFDDIERVTIVYDRLVKAGLNLVKATDELSRLQSFLSGGPDSRPDLTSASEIELRAIVVQAVRALGITDLRELVTP
ncbi:MAG: hypothetical protein L0206_02490, partial [Actinobacteria bacterium]|nr:hypothetical protein [Actinomycetota bacterium]